MKAHVWMRPLHKGVPGNHRRGTIAQDPATVNKTWVVVRPLHHTRLMLSQSLVKRWTPSHRRTPVPLVLTDRVLADGIIIGRLFRRDCRVLSLDVLLRPCMVEDRLLAVNGLSKDESFLQVTAFRLCCLESCSSANIELSMGTGRRKTKA